MQNHTVPPEIIDKIKKCFALTKSNFKGESETALRMATELMEKYGLEQADLDMTEDGQHIKEERVEEAFTDLKDMWPWEKALIQVTHILLAVECIYVPVYGKKGYKVKFIGVAAEAALAVEVYKILRSELMKLSRGEGEERDRREFRTGCTSILVDRAIVIDSRRQKPKAEQAQAASNALMVIKKTDLKAYVKEHYETEPVQNRGSSIKNSDAYNRGQAAGEQVNLDFHKGLK